MNETLLETKALTRVFAETGERLEILKGVDFSLAAHDFCVLTGASGSGKSTFLNLVGALDTPTSGEILFEGKSLGKMSAAEKDAYHSKKVGFVFQFHHLLPEFNALENVMIPAFIAGRSDKDAKAAATALLKDMGLGERMEHNPAELSGGEQQRVAIARALVNEPAILFADEPSGNLDSKTKAEIHQLFFDLRQRYGQTIVIVTHDPDLARMCDRSLFMRDGQFVEE